MTAKYRYHYYTVYIETDAFSTTEDFRNAAIAEAKERAHLWIVPCVWYASIRKRGGWHTEIRVTRVSNTPTK